VYIDGPHVDATWRVARVAKVLAELGWETPAAALRERRVIA